MSPGNFEIITAIMRRKKIGNENVIGLWDAYYRRARANGYKIAR